MLLLTISETNFELLLSMCRLKALHEQNVSTFFINTLPLLNPKRMRNMHFCLKEPVFSKFSQMSLNFANCKCITISMLICLKSELQLKEGTVLTVP